MKKLLYLTAFLLVITPALMAQGLTMVPFTSGDWNYDNAEVTHENYMGKESLLLSGGRIYLNDVNFLDGTIEVDVNFPAARFFPGIFFRMQDAGNYENFYIRPHQSGFPDATQYTPVFNGLSGWQLYHGEGYSQATELQPDTWHHIKIDVSGNQADVYYDDMTNPLIQITDLKRASRAGKIGLSTGSDIHFANFSYSKAKPDLSSRSGSGKKEEVPPGLITQWEVSEVLADNLYQGKEVFNGDPLNWEKQSTEAGGLINLARFLQRQEGMNTTAVRVKVEADEPVIKQLIFGYSDYVWVYVNDQIAYGGRNDYTSRDFRYLGTIGYFDAVYTDLREGDNEIVFVVGENFGGWGLKAFFEDMEGIELR